MIAAALMVFAFTTQPTGATTTESNAELASISLDPVTGVLLVDDSWCTIFVASDTTSVTSSVMSLLPDGVTGKAVLSVTKDERTVNVQESSVSLEGRYGVLTVSPDGEYTFALTVQETAGGETEFFNVVLQLEDGRVATKRMNFTFATFEHLGWTGVAHKYEINGTHGRDHMNGTRGIDIIFAGAGGDWVEGRAGDDEIYGESGDDRLSGDLGNNLLYGEAGDDTIYAGSHTEFGIGGSSTLDGGSGNDLLVGNAAGSFLIGGDGDDTLVSTYNNDTMEGGAGSDTFVLGKLVGNTAVITDFSLAERDILDITRYVSGGTNATLADIRSSVRVDQEADSSFVYAKVGSGAESKVAQLTGVLTDVDTLYGTGSLRTDGTELDDCGC